MLGFSFIFCLAAGLTRNALIDYFLFTLFSVDETSDSGLVTERPWILNNNNPDNNQC